MFDNITRFNDNTVREAVKESREPRCDSFGGRGPVAEPFGPFFQGRVLKLDSPFGFCYP